MTWKVEFEDTFKAEFDQFPEAVQNTILANALVLEREGPSLGRPYVDTLNNSKHANMKELRCTAANRGVWRVAFAFNPERKAILLTAGNKAGGNQKRFYKELIATADDRFDDHLAQLKRKKK